MTINHCGVGITDNYSVNGCQGLRELSRSMTAMSGKKMTVKNEFDSMGGLGVIRCKS